MKNSIFSLEDINISNEDIANIAIQKLQEKYHKKFKVCTIGERYGNGDNSNCKLVVQEAKNPLIIFIVILDINFEIIFDDYYLKKLVFKVEDKIRNNLSEDFYIRLEIVGKNTLDEKIELKTFLKNYKVRFIGFIISNKINEHELKECFDKLKIEYSNLKMNVYLVNVDEIEFIKIKEKMKYYPEINMDLLEDYKILKIQKISIKD